MIVPLAIRIGIDSEEWNKLTTEERLEQINIIHDILQKIATEENPFEPGMVITASVDAVTA